MCRIPTRWAARRRSPDRRAAVAPHARLTECRRLKSGSPSCRPKRRRAVFHVKQRHRSEVRQLGLCRTHAPSCPCLLGMGRHRGCPPRHHRAVRAVRRKAAALGARSPLGQHYRRAASLRPWGDHRHACPPDEELQTQHGHRCQDLQPHAGPVARPRQPTAMDEDSDSARWTPRLPRLGRMLRCQQDPHPGCGQLRSVRKHRHGRRRHGASAGAMREPAGRS